MCVQCVSQLSSVCITCVSQLARALCAVPLSQSSGEQLNSIIKLVHGDRRHCLKATVAEDEIVVRTSTMPEEELVHSAIREWATATHRRTACIKVNTSTPDMADSSSEGFSTSDDSTTDTASSVSGTSSSESQLDGEPSSGSSTTPSVSVPDVVAHAEPPAQCAPKAEGTPKVDAQVVHHCPVFKQMMEENEVLRSYAARLKELGYDRIDTLKYINADDMASINMLVGHRRLLVNTIQKLSGHPSTSHASS